MDKDIAARFVAMLLGVLKSEIAEASSRAERMGEAIRHNAAARDAGRALIDKIRNQRAEREKRLLGGDLANMEH